MQKTLSIRSSFSARLLAVVALCLSLNACTTLAQPDWTDGKQRQTKYPDRLYLVGYAEAKNTAKAKPEEFVASLAADARTRLSESVQVEIDNVTETEIEASDNSLYQRLQSTTVTATNINLVGLKTETHYDKKKRTGYAISYASKRDVIGYYRSVITEQVRLMRKDLDAAKKSQDGGNLQEAFRFATERLPAALDQITEAQTVLMALGEGPLALQSETVRDLEKEADFRQEAIRSSERLSTADVSYIAAFLVKEQIGEKPLPTGSALVGDFTYQDTELSTPLTSRIRRDMVDQLTRAGLSASEVGKDGAPAGKPVLSGTYWLEGERLKFIGGLSAPSGSGQLASFEQTLPVKWCEDNGVSYAPESLERLASLGSIKVTANGPTELSGKVSTELKTPFKARLTLDGKPLEGVPVRFYFGKDGKAFDQGRTDANGIAEGFMKKIPGSSINTHIVFAEVDAAHYLGVEVGSEFYQNSVETIDLSKVRYVLAVNPLLVYMKAEENWLGKPMSVKKIAPALKNELSSKGYQFVESQGEADYYITVRADAAEGGELHGLYSAVVNAEVSVTSLQTGREIYKDSFPSSKSAGASYQSAATKAFEKLAEKVRTGVAEALTAE